MLKGKLIVLLIQIRILLQKKVILFLPGCFINSFYEIGINASFFEELNVVIKGLILGLFFGYYYHIIEIFRKYVKHGKLLCGVEDVGFVVKTVYAFCVFVLNEHHGMIRWYIVISVIIGLIVWRIACKLFKRMSNICENSNKRIEHKY